MGGQPAQTTNAFADPTMGSLRYNTAQAGGPLPIVYGNQRVSVNLLEYWGFSGGQSGKGGKGGGGKGGKKQQPANYSVFVAFAFCQGPISYTGSTYQNTGGGVGQKSGGSGSASNRVWANAGVASFFNAGINLYNGDDGQAPDPSFEAGDPNRPVLSYSGTAYVTGTPLALGQSPSIPNLSGEITGFLAGTIGDSFPNDANPSLIVQDFLSNVRYGAGYPAANIDPTSFALWGNYCQVFAQAMSILMGNCQPASQWFDYILTHTTTATFFSAGLLKVIPYYTVGSANFGSSWAPDLTVQYSLTSRDFIDWGGQSDPVIVTRSDPATATNWFAVEYYDIGNSYNPNIAYRFDQGAIDQFGLRNEAPSEGHCYTNNLSAQFSASLQLQRKQQVRNKYKFKLGWIFSLLDPMDIVELTDADAGLDAVPVRITSITEEDDGLTIEAEELPDVASTTPRFVEMPPSSGVPNVFAPPGNPNPPVIFEPPSQLTNGAPAQAWMVVTGASAYWGGAEVWISFDDITFESVGTVYHGGTSGVLTAPFPLAPVGVDQTNTLSVDISESFAAELNSVSQADANSLLSLCLVEQELIAYQTSTLTGPGQYDLTYIVRGAYGTTPAAHPVGAPFARLNNSVFELPFPTNFIGGTFYIKLQSFNIYGQFLQDLTTVPAIGYTVLGTTLAQDPDDVTNLTDFYVGNVSWLSWVTVNDYRPIFYEIRKGATWLGGQTLGVVSAPPFQTMGNGTYWVGTFTEPAQGIKVYGLNPQHLNITGAVIAPIVLESWEENPTWPGTLGGSAVRFGSWVITTVGGDFLSQADFLALSNFLDLPGDGISSGSYTIPDSHIIDVGRVTTCIVDISWISQGVGANADFLAHPDQLIVMDFLCYGQSANVNVHPFIALSQDGSTWGAWQDFNTGAYTARAFKAMMVLDVFTDQVEAVLETMTFTVYPPERDDHYMNLSVPSGGVTIVFHPDNISTPTPFNGGPNHSPTPYIDATILGGLAGDVAVWSGLTAAQVTLEITNSGVGVARTVNVLAQGY